MAELAVAAIPNELNFEPITSIPPGYSMVQYKVPSYNNIPSPTTDGTEIQLNIPHTENTFLDPSTTYLDVAVDIECDFSFPLVENGRSAHLKNPGDFLEAICLNYLRGPAWTMFKRYQVYANNAILIEDIDEVGILTSMMNNLSKSQSTTVSGAAFGEDENDLTPGAKFGFCYAYVVPLFNRMSTRTGNFVRTYTINANNGALTMPNAIEANKTIAPTVSGGYLDATDLRKFTYGGYDEEYSMFRKEEVPIVKTPFAKPPALYSTVIDQEGITPEPEEMITQLGGLYCVYPNDAINQSAHAVNVAFGNASSPLFETYYPVLRAADGATTFMDVYSTTGTLNRRYRPGVLDSVRFGVATNIDPVASIPNVAVVNAAPRRLQFSTRFALPLFGLLGANNPKLYPLFAGPTQIRLTVENVTKFLRLGVGMQANSLSFSIREVNFCANQLVLSNDALRAVLQRLPTQGLIPIRCTTFTHSSELLNTGAQGLQQLLVASRRSSMKALFISYERSQDQERIVEGKYASIHPNIGASTHLFLNNTMYPRHGIDMRRNAADAYQQLLISLNQTQSALMRPNIRFSEFRSNDARYQILPDMVRKAVFMRPSVAGYVAGEDDAAVAPFVGFNPDVAQGFAMHPIEPYLFEQYGKPLRLGRNKAYTVIDTEHYAKRDFVSGVSTLTGNTFFNLQIEAPITSAYVVHFFNYHDAIVAFDVMGKNVTIKL